jgi:hypothetical protein
MPKVEPSVMGCNVDTAVIADSAGNDALTKVT